jgi:predicted phage-related endonuclease
MSLTEQQLIDRKKGLFGTDAGMLDETSPYNDPYCLYKFKRGEWDDALEPAIHLELGHELEDYVARKYCEKTGSNVFADEATVWNQEHLYNGKPFMGAHVDRWVLPDDADMSKECVHLRSLGAHNCKKILECKTAYTRNRWGKNGSGIIPPNYLSQIKHYCLVLGIHDVDVAVLHLPFPPAIEIHSFSFSQIELDDLLAKEYDMWDRIQTKRPPKMGSSATTNEKLRDEFSGTIEDSTVSSLLVDACIVGTKEIKAGHKDDKATLINLQNNIIAHMGEHEVLVGSDGDIIATFKPDANGVRKLLIK